MHKQACMKSYVFPKQMLPVVLLSFNILFGPKLMCFSLNLVSLAVVFLLLSIYSLQSCL